MKRTQTYKLDLSPRRAVGPLAALALLGGCTKEDEQPTEVEACQTDAEFFQERVYSPILAVDCVNCHNEQGEAKDTSFILRGSEWGPNYIEQNLEMFTQLAKLEFEGTPWILLKPSMGNEAIPHGGGLRFAADSEQYQTFQEMVQRIDAPTECNDTAEGEDFFAGVELLDEVATLRKATLSLVGRLPTLDEEQTVRDEGFAGLDAVLDRVMEDGAFYDRLKEIYNDHFLTDRYYDGTNAIDLLDGEDYPTRYWFDELGENDPVRGEAREFANRAVAREPLELVAHVVRGNLPYTEVLTADYTMVNWYSAQTFGVSFDGEADYETFQPAKIPGIPHAGVLTSTVWLNRFPTTDTNRNRHRSRMVYEFFLATDVQALGSRPVDASAITGVNPTRNDPNCTICHEVVDPMAGAFQNWDPMGRYRPPEMGWYAEMVPTGFGDVEMPNDNARAALQWMVRELVRDRRFALSAIHIMFKGLSGQSPLKEPDDPQAAGYLEAIQAVREQQQVFDGIAEVFAESNYNLKSVVKEIVKSSYYRAANATETLDENRSAELAEVGTGRLLPPEQLDRKVRAATGYPWQANRDSVPYLLDTNQYRIFYGGIDSDTVAQRITEPNGVMANIARRMANEVACLAVPQDFAKDASDRVMFPLVDTTYQPEDDNGFEVPGSAAAIRGNIQYLQQRLWGEYADTNDPETNRIFELFIGVWEDGKQGMERPAEEGGYSTDLSWSCQATADFFTGEPHPPTRQVTADPNYTVRAWMAVITYMLSDYRFLHE